MCRLCHSLLPPSAFFDPVVVPVVEWIAKLDNPGMGSFEFAIAWFETPFDDACEFVVLAAVRRVLTPEAFWGCVLSE